MEIKFHTQTVSCLKTVLHQIQTQEVTQEVRIPDTISEVGKILGCWGQVMIRGKEWRGSGMTVSGGVSASVLYAPEDGSAPQSVETWIPFQMKWEFNEEQPDGIISAVPALTGLDSRSISSNKLLVRANVTVLGEAMVQESTEIPTADGDTEEIEILKKTYPMDLPMESGEKMISLDETLTMPDSCPKPRKIICCRLTPQITEQRILASRLVFRGKADYHMTYIGENDSISDWSTEIAFSQFADLNSDYTSHADSCLSPVVTACETEITEDMHLLVRCGIAAQYIVFDRTMAEVAEDAYSLRRQVSVKTEDVSLPIILDKTTIGVTTEASWNEQTDKIAEIAVYPEIPVLHTGEDGFRIEVSGVYQILYYDADENLQCTTLRFHGETQFASDTDNDIRLCIIACDQPQVSLGADGLKIQQNFKVEMQTVRGTPITVAEQLEAEEIQQPAPGRPSLILRRTGNDTLWNLAKACGSTVAAIQQANQLSEEPDGKQLLIIPVS